MPGTLDINNFVIHGALVKQTKKKNETLNPTVPMFAITHVSSYEV